MNHYTVQKLATIAGVSVRTLHYYDEIGLLKPASIKENGYRVYGPEELLRLQQILFFRELEVSLDQIKTIISSPVFDEIAVLEDQKKLLTLKQKRMQSIIKTIDKRIAYLKGGESMNNDDLFKSFKDDELVENMAEAKSRWGDSDAYKQSMQKVSKWTKADYERIKKEGEAFTKELANAMDKDIKSSEVQALIEKHHEGIEYFYTCPPQMYRGLADMYVNDPRFTKYYDKHKPGLAKWVREAIHYYCDQIEKKK